ncbi:MAG: type III pantothenate kinase [Halieaceae bacterium]|nr:type III pantothenate kinase [Halieaceae bacterium]
MSCVLQIDAGNSAAKWRRVDHGRALKSGRAQLDDGASMAVLAAAAEGVDAIWLASVLAPSDEDRLAGFLAEQVRAPVERLRAERACAGVINSYEDPSRMGVDRWLALLAARRRHDGRLCVVDAGTALTIDFLSAEGVHEGGFIIAGRRLLESALFQGTGRVREGEPGWPLSPGRNTAAAVSGGASLCMVGALREALRQAGDPAPALIVTGGDGPALVEAAALPALQFTDLVFEGMEVAMGARIPA